MPRRLRSGQAVQRPMVAQSAQEAGWLFRRLRGRRFFTGQLPFLGERCMGKLRNRPQRRGSILFGSIQRYLPKRWSLRDPPWLQQKSWAGFLKSAPVLLRTVDGLSPPQATLQGLPDKVVGIGARAEGAGTFLILASALMGMDQGCFPCEWNE